MPLFGIKIENKITNIVKNDVSSRISAKRDIIYKSQFNTCVQAVCYPICGPRAEFNPRK
jgi:hypothetical protein